MCVVNESKEIPFIIVSVLLISVFDYVSLKTGVFLNTDNVARQQGEKRKLKKRHRKQNKRMKFKKIKEK